MDGGSVLTVEAELTLRHQGLVDKGLQQDEQNAPDAPVSRKL